MKELFNSIKKKFPSEWLISLSDNRILVEDGTLDRGAGYKVGIEESVRSYRAELEFGMFALVLQEYAEKQLYDSSSFVRQLFKANSSLSARVYRQTVEKDFDPATASPDGWKLVVEYRKGLQVPAEHEKFSDILLSFMLLLFPYDAEAEEEGIPDEALVTRYERSRVNRAVCLAFHGYSCKACGLNMQDQYGEIARQFIHVHHLNPVASGPTTPDPVRDMVPLCPNCHAIAHRRNPPFTVGEIRNMIRKNNDEILTD